MSNFGFFDLRVVRPYDVAFREARSAVHSHQVLEKAEVFEQLSAAIADCSFVAGTTSVGNRDLAIPLYPLEAASSLLQEQQQRGPVALLFGSEKFGLSNEDLSFCNIAVRIPSRVDHGSINLGQAVAICLYELRRSNQRELLSYAKPEEASLEVQERFTEMLLEALRLSSYINPRTAGSTELKLRRLVRRMGIRAADAETWLGMLRQMLWRLRQQSGCYSEPDDQGTEDV